MTTYQFFTTAWTLNSILLTLSGVAFVGYFLAFGQKGRPLYFAAALVVFLLAFISPFSALANGYLFSAHMVQHILPRADRSRAFVVKSTAAVLASSSLYLSYSSTDRMDCRSWCDVAVARADTL